MARSQSMAKQTELHFWLNGTTPESICADRGSQIVDAVLL
jgi:hypothetical protein